MTLTPEQREALEAALVKWDEAPGELYIEEEGFIAGMRYAYEDAAKICAAAAQGWDGGYVRNPYVAVPQDGCDDCAMAIRQRAKDSA
ncbi:MAG TPA: hypothetical protein VN650_10935 [Gemmatimonadaceae bacterium]|nr:hypothetical protein [Gemmatimonadaceae bacterium]